MLRASPSQSLLPELDVERGLQLAHRVPDAQLDVLGLGALVELHGRAALVVAVVRSLAGEVGDELVLAGLQVAEPDPLHAAAMQRGDLERGVEVGGDDLVVDLDLYRVEL